MSASLATAADPEPPGPVTGLSGAAPTHEPPEGIVGLDTDSWGEYPLDRMLIRNETASIHQAIHRIRSGRYVMDPDFRHDFPWDDTRQSKLIESVLLRIPVPFFYFAEDRDGRVVVVDGMQRLSAFRRFLDNELRLRLPDRPELDRLRFDDLPQRFQNRFGDCLLVFQVIAFGTPEPARLEVLERVNSGAALTRQQMRNSLYQGAGTRFLRDHAASALFLEATGGSLSPRTMRDREFVNRFCAFRLLGPDRYAGVMDSFLATALVEMNGLDPIKLSCLGRSLVRALRNNRLLFGPNAFRAPLPERKGRGPLNAALWEVLTTGLSEYSESEVRARADALRDGLISLLRDEGFRHSITRSTNSGEQVRRRFTDAHGVLRSVLGRAPGSEDIEESSALSPPPPAASGSASRGAPSR